MGAMRHFLAAQTGGAATPRREAERCRIEFRAAVLKVITQQGLGGDAPRPPS